MAFVMMIPADAGDFLAVVADENDTIVDPKEIMVELEEIFEAVLGVGAKEKYRERMEFVEDTLGPTFQALPKNKYGRIAPRAVRYLMHRYFNKVHSWTIEGLRGNIEGLDGLQPEAAVKGNTVGILTDTVPAVVEAALEAKQGGHGLSLTDIIAFVVALEKLITDESARLLADTYEMNGMSSLLGLTSAQLEDIIVSYASHFSVDGKINVTGVKLKQDWEKFREGNPMLLEDTEMAHDAVLNFEYSTRATRNPFLLSEYSFEKTAEALTFIGNLWGRSMDKQCQQMRSILEKMDPDGTGRVPVDLLRKQKQVSTFTFTETDEDLREAGALDESVPGQKMVRIANYMMSPSNCGEYSSYYSVCCPDRCSDIIEQIEGKFLSPMVDSLPLLYAVGNLSSLGDDLEGPLSPLFGPNGKELQERISVIAGKNGGQVPLHGSMFAQWLHYAFPLDCPHPVQALSPNHPSITPRDVEAEVATQVQIVNAVSPKAWHDPNSHKVGMVPVATQAGVLQWTEEESNPFLDELAEEVVPKKRSSSITRIVAQAAVILMFFTATVRSGLNGVKGLGLQGSSKKTDDDNIISALAKVF